MLDQIRHRDLRVSEQFVLLQLGVAVGLGLPQLLISPAVAVGIIVFPALARHQTEEDLKLVFGVTLGLYGLDFLGDEDVPDAAVPDRE